jgi:hypothetical protein
LSPNQRFFNKALQRSSETNGADAPASSRSGLAALAGHLDNLLKPDSWKFLGNCIHCSLLLCKLMRHMVQPALPSAGWGTEFRRQADFYSESCPITATLHKQMSLKRLQICRIIGEKRGGCSGPS